MSSFPSYPNFSPMFHMIGQLHARHWGHREWILMLSFASYVTSSKSNYWADEKWGRLLGLKLENGMSKSKHNAYCLMSWQDPPQKNLENWEGGAQKISKWHALSLSHGTCPLPLLFLPLASLEILFCFYQESKELGMMLWVSELRSFIWGHIVQMQLVQKYFMQSVKPKHFAHCLE